LCSSHLWFVESSLEIDAFELLDFYAYELTMVRPDNLVMNELESSKLSKEMLQVQGVVDEE
jgi:hypothetical protein